jgi:hypothetical protein
MTRLLAISLALSAAILSGCATVYGPEGLSHCTGFGMCRGGYSEERLDEKTFSVSFQGNKKTARRTTQKYLVYRCAELTVSSGYEYFVIVNENTEEDGDKYRANAVIQVFSDSELVSYASAYNARQILRNLGPEILR